MKRVVLGLSGGVDSAVAARLLQNDGWTVSGLYMDQGDAAARADARRHQAHPRPSPGQMLLWLLRL